MKTPSAKRQAIALLVTAHHLPVVRVCQVVRLARAAWYRPPWAEACGIGLDFIQPGKPAQNAFVERFNRTYRTEVLDAHVFSSLAEARAITADWLVQYNTERPHDSLGGVPPLRFLPRPSSTLESPYALST